MVLEAFRGELSLCWDGPHSDATVYLRPRRRQLIRARTQLVNSGLCAATAFSLTFARTQTEVTSDADLSVEQRVTRER